MGEVIQLQGDQRKDVQEFLVDKKEGLEMDPKLIMVRGDHVHKLATISLTWCFAGPWVLAPFPLRLPLRKPSSED